MTLGLITSFIITFTLLPTLLNFLSNNNIKFKKIMNLKLLLFLEKFLLIIKI